MVGSRLDYHNSPFGVKGGISLYPVSGVLSGCILSTTASGYKSGATSTAVVSLTAGVIRLDGNLIQVPALTNAEIITLQDLSPAYFVGPEATSVIELDIWINPTRKVPILTSKPTAPGSVGARALVGSLISPNYTTIDPPADPSSVKVTKISTLDNSYYIVDDIYKYEDSAWSIIDPMKDLGPSYGTHNALPYNDITPTVTATNLSYKNESAIFLKSGMPPHLSNMGNKMMRQSAGFILGTIQYTVDGATLKNTVSDYNLLNI